MTPGRWWPGPRGGVLSSPCVLHVPWTQRFQGTYVMAQRGRRGVSRETSEGRSASCLAEVWAKRPQLLTLPHEDFYRHSRAGRIFIWTSVQICSIHFYKLYVALLDPQKRQRSESDAVHPCPRAAQSLVSEPRVTHWCVKVPGGGQGGWWLSSRALQPDNPGLNTGVVTPWERVMLGKLPYLLRLSFPICVMTTTAPSRQVVVWTEK